MPIDLMDPEGPLYILPTALPASGKSTFTKLYQAYLKANGYDVIVINRDEVIHQVMHEVNEANKGKAGYPLSYADMHPENHWWHHGPIWGVNRAKHRAATSAMRQVLDTLAQKEKEVRTELAGGGKIAVFHDDLHITRTGRQQLLSGASVGVVERGLSQQVSAQDGQPNNVPVGEGVPENVAKVSILFELTEAQRAAMQAKRVANGGHRVPDVVMGILQNIYRGSGTDDAPENRPDLEDGFDELCDDGRTFTDKLATAIGFEAQREKSATLVMLEAFEDAGLPFEHVPDEMLAEFVEARLEDPDVDIKAFFAEKIAEYSKKEEAVEAPEQEAESRTSNCSLAGVRRVVSGMAHYMTESVVQVKAGAQTMYSGPYNKVHQSAPQTVHNV